MVTAHDRPGRRASPARRRRGGVPDQAGRPGRAVAAGAQPAAPEGLQRLPAEPARSWSRRSRRAPPTCSAFAPPWTPRVTRSSWSSRATMRFVEVNTTACTCSATTATELLELGPADLARYQQPRASLRRRHRRHRDEQSRRRSIGARTDAAAGRGAPARPGSEATGSSSGSCATSPSAKRTKRSPPPGALRRAHRPAQPHAVPRDAGQTLTRRRWESGMSPSCSSTSTISKASTTPWDTPSATSCWASSAIAWSSACPMRETVGRLSGDEFALILATQEDSMRADRGDGFAKCSVRRSC